MKSLYDFNYEQIQEFALSQGWKSLEVIKSFNGYTVKEYKQLMK